MTSNDTQDASQKPFTPLHLAPVDFALQSPSSLSSLSTSQLALAWIAPHPDWADHTHWSPMMGELRRRRVAVEMRAEEASGEGEVNDGEKRRVDNLLEQMSLHWSVPSDLNEMDSAELAMLPVHPDFQPSLAHHARQVFQSRRQHDAQDSLAGGSLSASSEALRAIITPRASPPRAESRFAPPDFVPFELTRSWTTVFVGGITSSLPEPTVWALLAPPHLPEPVAIRIVRKKPPQNPRFALVFAAYESAETAVRACQGLDGTKYGLDENRQTLMVKLTDRPAHAIDWSWAWTNEHYRWRYEHAHSPPERIPPPAASQVPPFDPEQRNYLFHSPPPSLPRPAFSPPPAAAYKGSPSHTILRLPPPLPPSAGLHDPVPLHLISPLCSLYLLNLPPDVTAGELAAYLPSSSAVGVAVMSPSDPRFPQVDRKLPRSSAFLLFPSSHVCLAVARNHLAGRRFDNFPVKMFCERRDRPDPWCWGDMDQKWVEEQGGPSTLLSSLPFGGTGPSNLQHASFEQEDGFRRRQEMEHASFLARLRSRQPAWQDEAFFEHDPPRPPSRPRAMRNLDKQPSLACPPQPSSPQARPILPLPSRFSSQQPAFPSPCTWQQPAPAFQVLPAAPQPLPQPFFQQPTYYGRSDEGDISSYCSWEHEARSERGRQCTW